MWSNQQAAATAQLAATIAGQTMVNWASVPAATSPGGGYPAPPGDISGDPGQPGTAVEKSLYCKGFPGGLTMREAQANFRWLDGFVELSLDSREDYSVIYALFYDKKSASKAIHKMNGRVYDPNIPDRVLHVQFGYREMTPSTHGKRRLDEIAAAQQAKRPRYEAGNPGYPTPQQMVLPQMTTTPPALPSTYRPQTYAYPTHSPSAQTTVANANPPIGDLTKRPARPPRNEPCTTLFMPFVPQGADEDLMRRIFEQQVGLTEVRFRTPKQRHFNLICFAEFDTIHNAIKARENLDGYMVEQCLYSTVPKLRNGLVCDFADSRRGVRVPHLPMLPLATGFQPAVPRLSAPHHLDRTAILPANLAPTAAVVITSDSGGQQKKPGLPQAPPATTPSAPVDLTGASAVNEQQLQQEPPKQIPQW